MYLSDNIKISLVEITKNPLRSFLSLLGVTIGIASLLSMIALNEGMKAQMLETIEQRGGANTIIIDDGTPMNFLRTNDQSGPSLKFPLSMDIVSRLRERFTEPVSPVRRAAGNLNLKSNVGFRLTVVASTPNLLRQNNTTLLEGRFLCDVDMEKCSQVIVINKELRDILASGGNPVLGSRIDVSGYPMEIVGTTDSHDELYIPITTAMKKTRGDNRITWIYMSAATADETEKLAERLREFLPSLTDNKPYLRVMSPKDAIQQFYSARTAFNRMLIGVTLISMLVGGIGIMNIMLASIKERIHEIGVRKAIGAKNRHIFGQMILESVFICMLGGIFGIILGIYGGESAVKYFVQSTYSSNLHAAISVYSILLAVGFSAVVGIAFGVYPALKAAKINPIDALRYE